VQYQSTPIPGFVAQIPSEATHSEVFSVCVEGAKKATSLGVATLVKPASQKGLLQWGFLNSRPFVKGSPAPLPKLPVASSSTMVVAEKGEDSRLNGLTQSQKWPVGFGPFGGDRSMGSGLRDLG
jgi:hypothetical protein